MKKNVDSDKKAKVTPEHIEEARRLKSIWDSKAHETQAVFGEKYQIGNQSAVGQFLRGEAPLSIKAAKGFSDGLGCPIPDFSPRLAEKIAELGALVTQETGEISVTNLKGDAISEVAAISVPLLAIAGSMGEGSEHAEDVVVGTLELSAQWVHDSIKPTGDNKLRFIHSYGDSMSPTLNSGDVLLVDSGVKEVLIGGIYVLKTHGRIFIKRVRQRMDGQFEISSDNPAVKTVDVLDGSHQVELLGRVVWVWNGRKL